VRIANGKGVKPGDIVRVKVTGSGEHDLKGSLSLGRGSG
jgi:hypothetical protein